MFLAGINARSNRLEVGTQEAEREAR